MLILIGYYNQDSILDSVDRTKELINLGDQDIEFGREEVMKNDLDVRFCPKDDCYDLFVNTLSKAETKIHCALYELDLKNLSYVFVDKYKKGVGVSIIIDGDYDEEQGLDPIYLNRVPLSSDGTRSKFMHNKFCVIDDKIVLTGSTNPTDNGFFHNNNNLIVFESNYIAKNYENEFNQLSLGKFGSDKESVLKYNNVTLKYAQNEYKISSYMCPQDGCEEEVVKVLQSAKEEILFANFVLTLDNIENLLIEKSNEDVEVKGVIENRMFKTTGSRAEDLSQIFEVKRDNNSYTMHHKVFVVDGRWVITGSMNPTSSGANYNDENLLIIESERIAKLYKTEILNLIDTT